MILSYTLLWIFIAIICGVIEVATLGLTTIWFAIGALVAWIFAVFEFPVGIQIAVFLVTSIILLYYTRPIAQKVLKIGHAKTNADRLVNNLGIVTEEIDNLNGKGQVKINGQIWSARTIDNDIVKIDEKVKVLEIQGVKLIVKKVVY